MTPLPDRREPASHPEHDVCLIADDRVLISVLTERVRAGIDTGEVCVVVATAPHRAALRDSVGASLASAEDTGRYFELDAEETLQRIAPNGVPVLGLFDDVIWHLFRGLTFGGRTVQFYGEMVGILWNSGNVSGALALEGFWAGLLNGSDCRLLCGYPVASADDIDDAYAAVRAAHQHASVLS